MTQKVIEGGFVTWRHMHEILRWLNFKLAQRDGSLFQARNSEMAQNSEQSISRIEFLFEF